ncbi:hypothetical protein BDY24DRAFT_385850 [Mrakia frigida]|uniref:rRNA-processing protein RRP17 n=1 Tax=Mrakia frigida TaxID=29902 RepID=UPI003FCBFA0F
MAPSRPSNSAILTQGKHYADRRKLAAKDAVEKVVFDDDARAEFLTGFSKRKQAKLTEKREKAKERDKLEQAKEKREFRQARKAHALQNFEAVERAYDLPSSSSTSTSHFPTLHSEPLDEENTYSDGEDQHATVTIMEDFDVDTSEALPFLPRTQPSSRERGEEQEEDEREEKKDAPPLGRKPKMMSGAKRKNKSGGKTLLRGTKGILDRKREARQRDGGGGDSGGGGGGRGGKSSRGGRGGRGGKK